MKRREMREHIFKLLFMGEFNTVEEMPEQSSLYFETLEELSPQEEEYMRGKYEKVCPVHAPGCAAAQAPNSPRYL